MGVLDFLSLLRRSPEERSSFLAPWGADNESAGVAMTVSFRGEHARPLAALAQQAGRTYRLGCLLPLPRDAPVNNAFFEALRHLLQRSVAP